MEDSQVRQQTIKWITEVVVGCNFCPFAARELRLDSIHYEVVPHTDIADCLQAVFTECERLTRDETIATTLIIFPRAFPEFLDYLDLFSIAEQMLKKRRYEGIYQIAGFHPLYQFADSTFDDAANYTNRSIYPMIHLLRESQVERVLMHYQNPGQIPDHNIRYAREKGSAYMKLLRESCIGNEK